MKDIVLEEIYAKRLDNLTKDSFIAGQSSVLELIKIFEAKKIEVTYLGMRAYLQELTNAPKIASVIARIEEVIEKAEEVLPIPDNVVNIFGNKK